MHGAPFAGTDRFEVVRLLGAGGMGEVYEAVDRTDDTRVALKVLRRLDARVLYRFKREFRSLQGLEHPGLVALGELHDSEGLWFFTMELVDGVDLLTYVRGPRTRQRSELSITQPTVHKRRESTPPPELRACASPLDEARLRASLAQLADALTALHDAGKIHRDVKPSNVLVDPHGRVVLLDFGLITESNPDLQSTDGEIVGTPAYMSPEQATTSRVGPPADCYAVGVLLFEALTGQLPFDGTPAEILVSKQAAAAPDPRQFARDVPADLVRLCIALLDPDPSLRPTAADIRARLAGTPARRTDLTLTRTPVFVGRTAELAAIDAALADVERERQPLVVHVHGPSGVGKSALIQQFVAGVRGRDNALVLSGRCYERELTHYRAFDGVIDAVVRHLWSLPPLEVDLLTPPDAALLARMFPMFEGVPSFASAPRPPPRSLATEQDSRTRAYLALRDLERKLAQRATLVIVIDDVQWADDDSLRLIAELLRPPHAPAALFVLVSRPHGDSGDSDDDGEDATARWLAGELLVETRSIPVRPLPAPLAESLAESLLDAAGLTAERAGAIATEAAGHPLHIAELVRHTRDGGGGERGVRLDQAIVDRVARMPEPARELARLVALAGAPIRPLALRRASTASALDFQRALAQLRIGHLLKRGSGADDDLVEPYHDRVREALTGSLDAAERRGLHARLAAALLAVQEPPELLLAHLEGAGQHERAASTAIEAAERAAAAMAYARAAQLYETALRLGQPPADERRALLVKMGTELANAGHGHAAARAFNEAAVGAEPETRMRCHQQAAEQLLLSGYIEEGLGAMADLLREIGTELPSTPGRALFSLVRGRLALALRGRRWRLRHESQIARERLAHLDVYKAVSHGLSMVDNIRGADFNARFLRLALATGEPARLCRAFGTEAIFLGSQGGRGLRRARAVLGEVERLASEQGLATARAWYAGTDGVLCYFAGRFREAADAIARGEELFRDLGVIHGYELNNLRMFHTFALSAAGEVAELRPLYSQWLAEAEQRGDRYSETTMRRRNVIVWLASGDVDGAVDSLARARWSPPEGRYHLQHWYEIVARAEVALCRGRAGEIADELDRGVASIASAKLVRVQTVRMMSRWLQARVHLAAASSGDRALAARRARAMASALRKEGLPLATTMAELIAGNAFLVEGDARAAISAFEAVVAGATVDTRLYEAVARRRLAELDAPDADAHATSAAAIFAALGITSSDTITQLFAPHPSRRLPA
ncbi:MAG TPA: protein kinase [Kofleriaceae bacterium]|nr:protein kinase [Kofleriaceae bacterium]